MRTRRKQLIPRSLVPAYSAIAATGAFLSLWTTPALAQVSVTTVATGLNNPRGLTFGPDGALYIAEAGIGGSGTSIVDGGGTTVAYGATSSITRVSGGVQSRVFTNGPSLAPTGGGGATGIHSLTFSRGQAYGVIGFGADPNLRSNYNATTEAGSAYLAHLVRFSLDNSNTLTDVADLGAYERSANPDGGEFNTNPYGLTTLPDGFAVVDAGGNSLLKVTNAGAVSTLVGGPGSVLGPQTNPIFNPLNPATGGPTYQAVPTGVAVNPVNGRYYFTELTGYPFVAGAANIFSYDPTTGISSVAYSGFTNLIGLTFDPLGNLYALQYDTNGLASPNGPGSGALIEITPNGNRTTLLTTGLSFPGGVAYGSDGALYVSNLGVSPGGGSVLRIVAAPEPGTIPFLALGGTLFLTGRIARRRNGCA